MTTEADREERPDGHQGEDPWWVVVNPRAARGSALRRTEEALRRQGIGARVLAPSERGEMRRAVEEGMAQGRGRFVAVGGDGTVHLVLNVLLARHWDEPPVLGILPAGTGCDFLRTFAIPQRLEAAARHLRGDQTYLADVGYLEGEWGGRYFLNVAQAGIGAASARRAARWTGLGPLRYSLAFWTVWPGFRRSRLELETERRSHRGTALMVVLANGQFFGAGMNIAPRANLVDGEVDVQIFGVRKHEAFALFPKVRRGLHLSHPRVRRISAAEFRLSTARRWPVEADGEYLGSTPLSGRVVRGAIRIKI